MRKEIRGGGRLWERWERGFKKRSRLYYVQVPISQNTVKCEYPNHVLIKSKMKTKFFSC